VVVSWERGLVMCIIVCIIGIYMAGNDGVI
jgi:hypothetical protein